MGVSWHEPTTVFLLCAQVSTLSAYIRDCIVFANTGLIIVSIWLTRLRIKAHKKKFLCADPLPLWGIMEPPGLDKRGLVVTS